ncbi:transposase [Aeromonas media]|uniref:transposase n=1 Tax=Aeromonas TaxID=642 RepID=UPI0038737A60
MAKQRRSFTAEFKLEAASLALDQGYSVLEASRSLALPSGGARPPCPAGPGLVNV